MSERVIQVVVDPRFQSHRGPDGHPERPERLIAINDAIEPFRNLIEFTPPRSAHPDEILRVHDDHLLSFLESTKGQPLGQIDADTYYAPLSYEVACLAAGSCVDIALDVMRGRSTCAMAAVRPPGHHAESNRSMGFCLFNNVAIAVRALQAEEDSPRVLVFDWDVHHGNGTQHIFESDRDVLYVSTHQFPFYPGTGDFGEAGSHAGLGATLNIPMPAGCGDSEYVGVLQRLVVPAAIAFKPDIILISCGFDAHADDPLASMEISLEGYRAMSILMRRLADDLCEGRIAFILEGGYSLLGVREGGRAVLESLTQTSSTSLPSPIELAPGSVLRGLVDRVVEVHGGRIPDLGAA
jgi:acetoin utilization deacetylase AcuC-like enzyme